MSATVVSMTDRIRRCAWKPFETAPQRRFVKVLVVGYDPRPGLEEYDEYAVFSWDDTTGQWRQNRTHQIVPTHWLSFEDDLPAPPRR